MPGQPQADEQARRQPPIGIAKDGAAVDRAGRRIELVVEELQRALVRERLLVGERHLDRQVALRGAAAVLAGAVAVAQERLLVGVERA